MDFQPQQVLVIRTDLHINLGTTVGKQLIVGSHFQSLKYGCFAAWLKCLSRTVREYTDWLSFQASSKDVKNMTLSICAG